MKENNVFYSDIERNAETLSEILENGNVFIKENSSEQYPINVKEVPLNHDDENITEVVVTSDAPNVVSHIEKRIKMEVVLSDPAVIIPWTAISQNLINEFTTTGYIAMAFPALFPTGAADLRSP